MPPRHRCVADLGTAQMGRTVTVPGDPPVTGVLVGVLPVKDRVSLALVVGSSRMFTDAMEANVKVELVPLADAPRMEVR